MEERVDVLVPYGYADVRISTFHAFGDWLLREHALELGLTPAFRVLNRAEQVLFLRTRLFELPLDHFRPLGDPTRHLQALTGSSGAPRTRTSTPEAYLAHAAALAAEAAAHPEDAERRDLAARTLELARTYAAYRDLMVREGFVDFGDQIFLALRLFRERPYVLAHYQRRFRYVLVDEFQDTNHAQFELVKLLAGRHRNVTVVGDDDQAIFRFRGASMSNILGFDAAYPDARRVVLVQNYRSGQRLLDAAYRLIRTTTRIGSRPRAGSTSGSARPADRGRSPCTPSTRRSPRRPTPSRGRSRRTCRAGRRAYRDFAILVRANADADPFLRSLNLRGIPWTFSGNQGLYGRAGGAALHRVPPGPRASGRLGEPLRAGGLRGSSRCRPSTSPAAGRTRTAGTGGSSTSCEASTRRPSSARRCPPRAPQAIARLVKELERYLGLAAELGTGELLYQFLADSGWLGRMSRASTAREEVEVQNVARFFRRIQDATQVLPRDHVREFVKHLDALDRGRGGSGGRRGGRRRARGARPHGAQGQGARVSGGVRRGAGPGPVSLAEPRRRPRAARRLSSGTGRRRRTSGSRRSGGSSTSR